MKIWISRTLAACGLIVIASLTSFTTAGERAENKSDSIRTTVNMPVEVDVLNNDNLGDKATISSVGSALNGIASVTADKQRILYHPNENFVGREVITYTSASADNKTEVNGTLTVEVASVVSGITSEQLSKASIVLFQALVLAVILEIGLQLLFAWRWFILHAEGRGIKTPIMFILALLLVNVSDIDVVQRLIGVFSENDRASGWVTALLSALIVGGGSSTVFQLFKALNLRPPASEAGGDPFRRAEFARVTFTVDRGEGEAKKKPLEVFVDGKLYGSIPVGQNQFPISSFSGLPVPTSATRFAIAIASDFSGANRWTRELSVSPLQSVDLYFDLTNSPPQPSLPQEPK